MLPLGNHSRHKYDAATLEEPALSLGARLKAARLNLELGQREVGELCGFEDSQNRISHYENDKRRPSLSDIELLAKALGLTPHFLAFGDEHLTDADLEVRQSFALADKLGKDHILSACRVARALCATAQSDTGKTR